MNVFYVKIRFLVDTHFMDLGYFGFEYTSVYMYMLILSSPSISDTVSTFDAVLSLTSAYRDTTRLNILTFGTWKYDYN